MDKEREGSRGERGADGRRERGPVWNVLGKVNGSLNEFSDG